MSETPAHISELFSSVQGEGLFVGVRQAFLRFFGCNLECTYCDTVSGPPPASCMIERTPGRRDFIPIENPVSLDRLLSVVSGWQRGWPAIHHSLSITGGEPLLHHEVLKEWLPKLKSVFPIYLETNGVLHSALAGLITHLDHICMDIKLPSSSGCGDLWNHHRHFLQVAARKNVFVKTVVNNQTEDWEIIRACEIIANVARTIPLILQPVSLDNGKVGVAPLKVLELQEIASGYLAEVRIVPQTHKFMGQL